VFTASRTQSTGMVDSHFPFPNVLIPLHFLVFFHSKFNSKSKPVKKNKIISQFPDGLTHSIFSRYMKNQNDQCTPLFYTLFYLAFDFLILVRIKRNNKEFNYVINPLKLIWWSSFTTLKFYLLKITDSIYSVSILIG